MPIILLLAAHLNRLQTLLLQYYHYHYYFPPFLPGYNPHVPYLDIPVPYSPVCVYYHRLVVIDLPYIIIVYDVSFHLVLMQMHLSSFLILVLDEVEEVHLLLLLQQ